MSTVHANQTETTSRRTTVRSRRKTAAEISCSGCGATIQTTLGCRCLRETTLYREAIEFLPSLVNSARGVGPAPVVYLAARRCAREGLEQIIAREEQRKREEAAYRAFIRAHIANPHPRFSAQRDREVLDQLFGIYRTSHSARTLDEVAVAWHRPVAYVRDLRDRCLQALRRWPTEKRSTSTASRRAVA